MPLARCTEVLRMNGSPKRKRLTLAAVVVSGLSLCATDPAFSAEPFALGFPVKCEPGSTCFVQNYVDHDSSEKVGDYSCGSRTYNGHDGTDIRVPDLAIQRKGVEVLAAAAGRVTNVRDGMTDVSVRVAGKAAIAGKECGNGAVIEHEQGWSTQYCHMAKGSLRVKPGDQVTAGQAIGSVGLSGDTEFPHLHLTVRHSGSTVDPFAYEAPPGTCNGGHSIWRASLFPQIAYHARDILNFGFADVPVTMDLIETGEVGQHVVTAGGGAIVGYIRTIGLQTRDVQTLRIQGPDGQPFAEYQAPALDTDKAQFFVSAGRKRR